MNSLLVGPNCKAFISSCCIALVCLFAIFLFTQPTYAASEEKKEERARSDASFLHYFSPEITLAVPNESSVSLVIRLHHRSGAGGLFGESGGFQYLMLGLRAHF